LIRGYFANSLGRACGRRIRRPPSTCEIKAGPMGPAQARAPAHNEIICEFLTQETRIAPWAADKTFLG
jgi:hypothetical protein